MKKNRRLWQSLLTAEMNVRYWKQLVLRYSKKEKLLKIFLAATASASVAGWTFWQDNTWLWKLLSAVATLVSLALPMLDYPKLIEQMAGIRALWLEQRGDYERLWDKSLATSDEAAIEMAFEASKARELSINKSETHLPEDLKLLGECQQAVLIARNITKG
jgi:hypothetical protein